MLNGVQTFYGVFIGFLFVISYVLVVLENRIKLKKSKTVVVFSSFIWILVSLVAYNKNCLFLIQDAVYHSILEFSKLFLFLFVTMVYINVLEELDFFCVVRCFFLKNKVTTLKIFWVFGFLSFSLSPIIDNLTTVLVLGSMLATIYKNNFKFLSICCVNIVVASNSGGSFSPFGDLTTLMVWQSGILNFFIFLKLFLPSFINFIIPSFLLSCFVKKEYYVVESDLLQYNKVSFLVFYFFLLTLLFSVFFELLLNIPSVVGMMTGFGFLCFLNYFIKFNPNFLNFSITQACFKIDWETLIFFYGIILSVSGIAIIGYLNLFSFFVYTKFGGFYSVDHYHTCGNILIGLLSAVVDNIPVMYTLLTLDVSMSEGQWLLVTLTTGIGGSLFSIGSAAGIALMGKFNYCYNFFSHLKWSWVILIGYFVSIFIHIILNDSIFFLF